MKSGYKRLLIFELIIITILLLNNFVSSILNGYIKVLFIIGLLLLFKYLFGFEKDRHRYWKSICLEILIFLLVFFILYYASGLVISFYKNANYYSVSSFVKIIIPIVIITITKEILRYMIISKINDSRLLMIITCILFILIDLVGLYNIETFKTPYNIFIFSAINLFPCISKNILCTYIAYKTGYKPAILYLLILELYVYLVPIIPNPNQYIYALIQLIIPFVLLYRIYVFFKVDRDEDIVIRKNKGRIIALIPTTIIVLFLAYFTCGYFYYHAIVIGSGSMEPNILKGDVVVIEKTKDYDDLEVGEIIAVKHSDVLVIHRLVKKIKVDDQYYYYTKGDANNDIDNYKITSDMIYGVVNVVIPYIGSPTVWLRNI